MSSVSFNIRFHTLVLLLLGVLCIPSQMLKAQEKGEILIDSNPLSLLDIFSRIEEQTAYSIAYSHSGLDLEKEFFLPKKRMDIEELLSLIIDKTTHRYLIKENHVLILPLEKEPRKHSEADRKRGNRSSLPSTTNEAFLYTGTVIDSLTQKPMEYATVYLADRDEQTQVIGVTNQEGRFRLYTSIVPHCIRISFIGYRPFSQTFEEKGLTDLGIFSLSPEIKQLNEVNVTASHVEHLVDRNRYLITEKMRSKAADVQDLLGQLPGVHYDKLSNSIRVGNETLVLLLVDGMQQPEAYIKNLPPDRIHKVEVITEPTGKYLSENYTAIINFILKKDYSGYDVRLHNFAITNLAGNNGDDWLVNDQPGIGMTYTKDKINVFANYVYARIRWNDWIEGERSYTDLLEMYSEGTHSPNNRYKYQANYTGAGINYEFIPGHTLSLQGEYAFQKYGTDEQIKYNAENLVENKREVIINKNHNRTQDKDYSGTLFYTGEINDQLKIYSDLTYNYYTDDVENNFFQNETHRTANLYTENKNYIKFNFESNYQLSNRIAINGGYTSVWRKYNSKSINGAKLLDYSEERNNLFASVSYKPNDKLSTRIGSGLESIRIRNRGKKHYWNVLPFFQLSYRANDQFNIQMSYTTTNSYPSLYQLSPLTTEIDSLMKQTGNPELQSSLNHTLSASFTFWDRITVKPMFKYSPDRISAFYETDHYWFYNTFKNINFKQYLLQTIYDQPLGENLSFSNTFTYYHNRAGFQKTKNSYSGWLWNSEISYFHPRWDFGAQIGYHRNMDKNILPQGYQMTDMDAWLITLNKQFLNKRASLMLSYFPPLSWGIRNSQQKEIRTSFYTERQDLSLKTYKNMLLIKFSLRFNNGKTRSINKRSSTEREQREERTVF